MRRERDEATDEMFRKIHENRHLFTPEKVLAAMQASIEGSEPFKDEYKPYRVGEIEWIYPHEQEPPTGVDLHILQFGGSAIRGQWRYGVGFIAWQYMFKRNKTKEAEFFKWMDEQGKTV
jgi:hypothetical protein